MEARDGGARSPAPGPGCPPDPGMVQRLSRRGNLEARDPSMTWRGGGRPVFGPGCACATIGGNPPLRMPHAERAAHAWSWLHPASNPRTFPGNRVRCRRCAPGARPTGGLQGRVRCVRRIVPARRCRASRTELGVRGWRQPGCGAWRRRVGHGRRSDAAGHRRDRHGGGGRLPEWRRGPFRQCGIRPRARPEPYGGRQTQRGPGWLSPALGCRAPAYPWKRSPGGG